MISCVKNCGPVVVVVALLSCGHRRRRDIGNPSDLFQLSIIPYDSIDICLPANLKNPRTHLRDQKTASPNKNIIFVEN